MRNGVRLSLMPLDFRLLRPFVAVSGRFERSVSAAIPEDLSVIHGRFGVSPSESVGRVSAFPLGLLITRVGGH